MKKFILLLSLILIVALFGACSSEKNQDGDNNDPVDPIDEVDPIEEEEEKEEEKEEEEEEEEVDDGSLKLTIEAGTELYPFTNDLLGSNVGIWTNSNYYPKASPKLVNMVKQAGMGILRYPAGAEADDTYFDRTNSNVWYEGPAPYSRTMRADHLDAFIALCKESGAEPMIVINAKIDSTEMAADMVKYMNIENDYGVKYFEIGNEPGYWKGFSSKDYPERLARYADAMKAVDPNIIIINAGEAQPTTNENYLLPVLEAVGDKVDAVNVHWYPLFDQNSPTIDKLLTYDTSGYPGTETVSQIAYVNRFVKGDIYGYSLTELRDTYSPGSLTGVTEISPVAGGNSEPGVSETLANALWFGDVLGRLAYNGLDFATQFLLISQPQMYAMTDYNFKPRPVWYTYVMYNRYFGDMMLESKSNDSQNLTIWASTKDGEDDKLYVMVINKNQTDDQEATIKFKDFTPSSTGLRWELNGENIDTSQATINDIAVNQDVELPEIDGIEVEGVSENFTYTFPAHSITCFEFTK